jgi:hypothetical protein
MALLLLIPSMHHDAAIIKLLTAHFSTWFDKICIATITSSFLFASPKPHV